MRPLSLFRPSARALRGRAGDRADSVMAGAGRGGPHRVSAAAACLPGQRAGSWLVTVTVSGSGGGQRVVAEFGQDVAGLAEDLAGFGHGGALAVLAVLDGCVVVVVGGAGPGVGLA